MATQPEERLHLFGIRHHGPGSAALLRRALDALDPACVLIEGPPEGDALIRWAAEPGMQPPLAMLVYASEKESAGDGPSASFMPFAEFSPEWQAMLWALERQRPVRFIDWPAAVSLALRQQQEAEAVEGAAQQPDALDLLAEAAGYDDGEAFWNGLVEQYGAQHADGANQALTVFAAIETAMTEARAHEQIASRDQSRDLRREAFMRTHIRAALKEHDGAVAVVCGAWHLSALRAPAKAADDRALIKDLPRIKVEATWAPWTDSRLSAHSGYGAGVLSPGWYRHLWSLYAQPEPPTAEQFASLWQARTAQTLRGEGYGAPTANAIEAARLALGLAALRGLPLPGLSEMREAALATFCHGNPVPLALIERKLYIGQRVGEIDDRVPQMPLARDLTLWQRKTRMKPEDLELEMRLDLRSEAGLLKSTLLHRLNLIDVPWGKLLDAQAGRGTFREVWMLRWAPEFSVALAEALVYGITIEQAAAGITLERARASSSVTALAGLVRAALTADLPDAATDCIAQLQAAAVNASDITDLMQAVAPLVRVLRYGTARKLPEDALRALVGSLSIEINAGVRIGSHSLDADAANARVKAMEEYGEALTLFDEASLTESWRQELAKIVDDELAAAPVAGLSLRRLHDQRVWPLEAVAAAFARHTGDREPQHAGAFLEGFLRGGAEIILHDEPLLHLIDAWLCSLAEDDFIAALPLLRRSLTGFDQISRRRLLDTVKRGQREHTSTNTEPQDENPAFAAALPLLYRILGMETGGPA
ncbi:hypothetical protein SAMN05421770_104122 [Granulicella rosea]|uniref:Uncharacterized protein n=1 Tax=Granulicella rosea TaxID=474952 RepID=A0A239JTM0_9BACT|nr:DUF5682 family protein [Granulicella rosea]SNT09160.1 hypothetical protein SAMN05421770_104122 [Granulicella rosea]